MSIVNWLFTKFWKLLRRPGAPPPESPTTLPPYKPSLGGPRFPPPEKIPAGANEGLMHFHKTWISFEYPRQILDFHRGILIENWDGNQFLTKSSCFLIIKRGHLIYYFSPTFFRFWEGTSGYATAKVEGNLFHTECDPNIKWMVLDASNARGRSFMDQNKWTILQIPKNG